MTPNKLLRLCPLILPLLLSLSAFQSAFAQGAPAVQVSTRVYLDPTTPPAEAITGFIITGTGTGPKRLLVRGLGPSLALPPNSLVPDITDPVLGKGNLGSVINDNWSDTTIPVLLQPGSLESATMMDFSAGHYTVILSGSTAVEFGFAMVDVYDRTPANLKLANFSTRAFVGINDNIVIAGFILVGGGSEKIVVRGLGPSLTAAGVSNVLANPVLDLCCKPDGTSLLANDDWQDEPSQAAEITALGLAPTHSLEAGLIISLPAGSYSALLRGLGNTTGNGLVEIYDVGP